MLSLRLITLIFLSSCASLTAPVEYVPSRDYAREYPYGAYIEIKTKRKKISGEFIGISENNIFARIKDEIYFLPIGDVKGITIVYYRPSNADILGLVLWTLLGAASTVSHGFLLIISAPVWALSGLLSIVIITNEPVKALEIEINKIDSYYPRYPQSLLDKIKQMKILEINKINSYYSRYPQGLPDEIKQKAIRLDID